MNVIFQKLRWLTAINVHGGIKKPIPAATVALAIVAGDHLINFLAIRIGIRKAQGRNKDESRRQSQGDSVKNKCVWSIFHAHRSIGTRIYPYPKGPLERNDSGSA